MLNALEIYFAFSIFSLISLILKRNLLPVTRQSELVIVPCFCRDSDHFNSSIAQHSTPAVDIPLKQYSYDLTHGVGSRVSPGIRIQIQQVPFDLIELTEASERPLARSAI